ncbi:MFS transporter [Candidatus Pelagibacter communis]|uniref:MFS transporter n=1 Tax=Pelagibacter ubique TaxID=198252 RepID=UPI000B05B26F|nr:MFS transporter [Candidatus Pelagibacter ubique]
MNRNLSLLVLSQVFSFTAATVTVFISGIIGSQLSPIKTLSTLPPSIYVVGTAAATIIAAKIMSIIGRRLGFVLASVVGSISCLIGAYAIMVENFYIFCFAKFLLGATMAFTHQYRFAAAESVEKEKAPKAISSLLLAGIVAAFLGISLSNYTKNFVSDYLYVGSYLTLAILTIIPSFLLFFFKDIREVSIASNENIKSRNYLEFLSDPKFLQAITSAAFAYAVMSFLMTATPISMHIVHQLSLEKTGIVLQFHVLAMFLPSLVTGNLIKKFGYSNMMYSGVVFYILTILLSFFEPSFLNYFISLIFLGIGWNFLFISGTSLLVTTYKPDEKFKAQGFNDLLVFSSMALASLLAGILISIVSWKIVNLFCIPFLILIILSIVNADKKR